MSEMNGNGSIVWLMLSVLQAIFAFTGVLPPEMMILERILGGNSIAFFVLFLYFMLKRKPEGFLDSDYSTSERTTRTIDEVGNTVDLPEKSKGSRWERWASALWFIALIFGTASIL